MEKIIKDFQRRIVALYRSGKSKQSLHFLSQGSCSESSRLVAIWIKRKFDEANLYILKGEYKPKKYHDVLIVEDKNIFYLIDPSVWQFFKNKKGMLMGKFNNLENALEESQKIYGGKWNSVENFNEFDSEEELVKIIKVNISYEQE
jgi:hypothetical protein